MGKKMCVIYLYKAYCKWMEMFDIFLPLAVFSRGNTSVDPVLYIVDWEIHWNDSFAQFAGHRLEKFLNSSLIEVI